MDKCIKIAVPVFIIFAILFSGAFAAGPDIAVEFKLQDIHNNTIALSSYKNKQPVLLFFWTTWCPLCRSGLKALNNRYAELAGGGLEVLAINSGENSSKVENFVKANNLNYEVLLDEDIDVASAYQVFGVPTYVLVDKNGYVAFRGHHFPEEEYKKLIAK